MRYALLTSTGGGGVSGGWRRVPDHQVLTLKITPKPAVKETAGFSFFGEYCNDIQRNHKKYPLLVVRVVFSGGRRVTLP